MKTLSRLILICVVIFPFLNATGYAAQTITAQKVDQPPVIDGKADDDVWKSAPEFITHDKVADIDITLKAVYMDTDFKIN